MTRFLPTVIAMILAASAGGAWAQTAPSEGTISVREAVAISSMRPMRLQPNVAGVGVSLSSEGVQADAPALVQVTGDPGSVYRIRVPQVATSEGLVVEGLAVSSLTSGDITGEGVARMDAEGRDVLTISGRLRRAVSAEGAIVSPLTVAIAYE